MYIGIIGHFGGDKEYNDGQTVKTKNIYNGFCNSGISTIDKIDTYYIKKNPAKFLFVFLKSLIRDEKYIVLLSINGRRIMFPVLFVLSKLGKEVYHYSIGGRLAREVKEHPSWKKYVSSFKGNWMESHELTENLQSLGVNNAVYIPNFKNLNILNEDELYSNYTKPYRFCVFSRIMKEKGVSDAIHAVNRINEIYGAQIAELDIFGPIDDAYKDEFITLIEASKESCRYCGVIDSNKSVEAIKPYFALLFPTHWKHEGIPGTIIDAFSAGVPVIARKWQYCKEMITAGENGYCYDFEKPELLVETMKYAIEHAEKTISMKRECLKKASEYSEKYVMMQIKKEMGI